MSNLLKEKADQLERYFKEKKTHDVGEWKEKVNRQQEHWKQHLEHQKDEHRSGWGKNLLREICEEKGYNYALSVVGCRVASIHTSVVLVSCLDFSISFSYF